MFNYMSPTQNSFWTQPYYKNSPLLPQKVKNSPKTKSNSKVTIEESIENESCATILADPKKLF